MVFGAGEGSCEGSNASEGGALKPGADACLEDGEGVSVYVPFLEEEVVLGMSRSLRKGSYEGGRG